MGAATSDSLPGGCRQTLRVDARIMTFGIFNPGGHTVGVDPELLKILACPSCKTPVVLVHDETGLKCKQCHRVYPIKDDIPVMLIDESTIEL